VGVLGLAGLTFTGIERGGFGVSVPRWQGVGLQQTAEGGGCDSCSCSRQNEQAEDLTCNVVKKSIRLDWGQTGS
jgi:hypothetical protein